MRRLLALLLPLSAADATVLIQGESGAGKELVARTLHARSTRQRGPFVAINCAAIPDALLESELFGFERGAFTGAARSKPGRIELAQGGTLFLDEIAELTLPCQAKLLRALQEREVERLGGVRPFPVDVRVVAASNQELRRLVEDRRFREDLYYRLNVITLRVPPLRERREDLVPLAQVLLERHARRVGRSTLTLGAEAVAALHEHDWPGNVRELDNCILRAVILSTGPEIARDDLGLPVSEPGPDAADRPSRSPAASIQEGLLAVLARCGGKRHLAAKMLGIDRSTLWRQLRRYGLAL